MRIISGEYGSRDRFHKIIADLFGIIFIISVISGILFFYDRGNSWLKLFFLLISVSLFYLFAFQPKRNLWFFSGILSLLGAGMAFYFLVTNDWQQNPAKIGFINQVGLWWMTIRPQIFSGGIYHNSAAGVMALSFPFTFASIIHAWQKKQILRVVLLLFLGGISLFGFLLTTSRGAALAVFYGFLIGFLYELSKRLRTRFPEHWLKVFRQAVLPLLIAAAGWSFMLLAGPVSFSDNHSVLTNSGSRLELYQNSIKLAEDFPFTGVGLSAFPGAYSTYILGIPNFFFQTAHNLYLNIAVEQGIFGFLSLIAIYLFSIWSILKYEGNQDPFLVGGLLASLVIVMLHNLVDNVIGDSVLAVLLFVIPGFAYAVVRSSQTFNELSKEEAENEPSPGKIQISTGKVKKIIFSFVISAVVLIILFFRPLLSTWHSNIGAAQMAKIGLAGFPTNAWDEGQHLPELAPAEANFLQSLQYNPANRTANHRLGLIAMMRRDFPTAVVYLERAYQVDPDHRGIIKNLGYAYTWTGQFDKALPLLAKIPESRQELDTYQWWWGTHNRQDLSANAAEMAHTMALSP